MKVNRDYSKDLSTTALAKALNKEIQVVFQQLIDLGLIVKNGDTWDLTPSGKAKGGIYKDSNHGRFIAWPESFKSELEAPHTAQNLVTATSIGKSFDLPASRVNSILSELGWIIRDNIKGWQITNLGKRLGGVQSRDHVSGVPYVRWPDSIITNKLLTTNISEAKGTLDVDEQPQVQSTSPDRTEFRDKFRPEHRAQDGHFVRSKSEIIIDNWLYVSKTVHAYERKLPIEEEMYCDFYIPTGKVYIEYWGSDEEKYLARKDKKLEIYKKYGFKLIQLTDKDIYNLDDILPRKLLEFGVVIE